MSQSIWENQIITDKGKPIARWGRKVMGPMPDRQTAEVVCAVFIEKPNAYWRCGFFCLDRSQEESV